MTKQEHISYWLGSAEKERDMMMYSFEGAKYVYALFFGHLFLEKTLKAAWVKANEENVPPKTHNLIKLLGESGLNLDDKDQAFLLLLNQYQLESRYPNDIEKLYKVTDHDITKDYIARIKEIEICLRNNLQ